MLAPGSAPRVFDALPLLEAAEMLDLSEQRARSFVGLELDGLFHGGRWFVDRAQVEALAERRRARREAVA